MKVTRFEDHGREIGAVVRGRRLTPGWGFAIVSYQVEPASYSPVLAELGWDERWAAAAAVAQTPAVRWSR